MPSGCRYDDEDIGNAKSLSSYITQTGCQLPQYLHPVLFALTELSPSGTDIVINLVQGLAKKENIDVGESSKPRYSMPEEGIPQWVSCLKAEQYFPRTIHNYRLIVRRYLKLDPTPDFFSIQTYLAKRLDEVSTVTVSMERKALRSFFRFLHDSGLSPTDPTVKLKPIKVRYKERVLPTFDEISKLLKNECFHRKYTFRFRLMTILLLDTGLRLAEACSIRTDNIYLSEGEIKVCGKGNRERIVPISEITTNLLCAWMEANRSEQWLFPANNPNGYWDEISFEKSLRKMCIGSGILPFTPHALRHLFATCNLKSGARLEVVSRILGHASTAITADIYVHVDRDDIHLAHKQYAPLNRMDKARICEMTLSQVTTSDIM